MRSGKHKSKAFFPGVLILFGALLLPSVAEADCPPPQTPPPVDGFYFCFDGTKIAPQPIIDGDKGPFIVAEVELNGHKLPALFDTGAGISIVDSSVAKEIGLRTGDPATITVLSGQRTTARKAPIDQLVIGGYIRKGGIVAVTDMSALRRAVRQPFAMIVGADVLLQVALLVDRDANSVFVIPNNAKVNGLDWTAPLRIQQPGNLMMTDLTVDGHPITVKLDTGAEDELILGETKWAEIVPPTARVTTFGGGDLAGPRITHLVRFNDVRIGGKSIGDAIATQVPSAPSTERSDGVLGVRILSRYNLFLNPEAGVMLLAELKKPAPPRRETMVGIQGPPTDDGIAIMHVMAHSPAEAAGLKAGDRICTIDGETVRSDWSGTPKNDWMTGPEGKTVVLGRCGGGSVKLTLRRFY
jgi:hypothetical protein